MLERGPVRQQGGHVHGVMPRVRPGPASGAGRPLATRSRDRSRWVGLGVRRSRCASTIAPSAAVISRALVTSNGNTYVVKISLAIAYTLFAPKDGPATGAVPRTACPTVRLSSASSPMAARPAATRCP